MKVDEGLKGISLVHGSPQDCPLTFEGGLRNAFAMQSSYRIWPTSTERPIFTISAQSIKELLPLRTCNSHHYPSLRLPGSQTGSRSLVRSPGMRYHQRHQMPLLRPLALSLLRERTNLRQRMVQLPCQQHSVSGQFRLMFRVPHDSEQNWLSSMRQSTVMLPGSGRLTRSNALVRPPTDAIVLTRRTIPSSTQRAALPLEIPSCPPLPL